MMNAMAMHQTLFGNAMIFGQGFTQGENTELTETVNGWKLSVNGLNPMPELSSEYLLNRFIGSVEHDSLMIGMPSAGGVIDYHIVETEAAYALVVGVKLDPSLMEESEMHYEYAAVLMKDDLTLNWRPKCDEAFLDLIVYNLFFGHFEAFLDPDLPETTIDSLYFDDENEKLKTIFRDYIQILLDLEALNNEPIHVSG